MSRVAPDGTAGSVVAWFPPRERSPDPSYAAGVRGRLQDGATERRVTTFTDLRGETGIELLALDLAAPTAPEPELEALSAIKAAEVAVHVSGADPSRVAAWDSALRRLGYRRAGRPWGEAGCSRVYVTGLPFSALAREAKVAVGALAVQVRDRWLSDAARGARERRREAKAAGVADLDPAPGRPLPSVQPYEIDRLIEAARGDATWDLHAIERDPAEAAAESRERFGVLPISFSYPRPLLQIEDRPACRVSPIVPGVPYAFDDEQSYLRTYRGAEFGITHRKAGWDCFRHLEILATGATPLMPDASLIPPFAMTHYPKRMLAEVTANVRSRGGTPSRSARERLRLHVQRHLTSEAMARYLLEQSGFTGSTVAFVDERLAHHGDYLSVLTLIGLKQLLGAAVTVPFPVPYVYDDAARDPALYGRGFGYTNVLPTTLRAAQEAGATDDPLAVAAKADLVVIGSISRNGAIARALLDRLDASRMVWLHGEDAPPAPLEVRGYRDAGVTAFVRAIHAR